MTIVDVNRSREELFDLFCSANSFGSILKYFHQLCAITIPTPIRHPWDIYRQLSLHLKSHWKASALLKKLDKRVHCIEYARQTVCDGLNVVVIGCGPCGLRCAIELALLGARVVIIEKRDAFSRNNVLHLWPYLIEDLRALGAKTFFGKFCAGSIDHISIRTLQCILLKVALLFGIQVFPGVTYHGLIEPISGPVSDLNSFPRVFLHLPDDDLSSTTTCYAQSNGLSSTMQSFTHKQSKSLVNGKPNNSAAATTAVGWRVQLEPELSVLKNYEIDVLIGADGKRSCLGFPCKELRCRLAIAITANFINYHTQAETEVEEISGVASIFNQQFFSQLAAVTGIDLENLVYYKDETHYFVMTAKKHSLLAKGVLRQDCEDSESLLSAENVDNFALQAYAREMADFVTGGRLPRLDFAVNARGQPDVDVFDFTRMFAADYSCRIIERRQRLLIQCLVGDGLFEPFWPTGSGCALGFLSALDAAWAVKRLATGCNPLHVLAQRESVYQRLSQTTAQNMPANFWEYTLDPRTRYIRCNLNMFAAHQVSHLYDADRDKDVWSNLSHNGKNDVELIKNLLREQVLLARSLILLSSDAHSHLSPLELLRWLQCCLSFYVAWDILDCPWDLSPEVWESGHHLLCLIHLHRPELIPEIEGFLQERENDNQNHKTTARALFSPRGATDTRPLPTLIRAYGLFIEHFNVILLGGPDRTSSSYPKCSSDWFTYLSLVYHALCSSSKREPKVASVAKTVSNSKSVCVSSKIPTPPLPVANKRSNIPSASPPVRSRLLGKSERSMGPTTKRVFRENPKWSVEKGLLSKRRAAIIATLKDPSSDKRRSPVLPMFLPKKRSSASSEYVNRSSSPPHRSSTFDETCLADSKCSLVRSRSNQETRPATIKPVTIPANVARLFTPHKSSSHCYVCQKPLYLTERQTAFDLYFHRLCFRCAECDIPLQPGKATRVRATPNQGLDKFYCPAHSPVAEPEASRPTRLNNTTGASLVDRLRSGQFPFGVSQSVCANESHKRKTVLDMSHAFGKPTSQVSSMLHRSPLTSYPARSALLAGLMDEDEPVMGVNRMRALIQRYRAVDASDFSSTSSSSSSPVQTAVAAPAAAATVRTKLPLVGPAGDLPAKRTGIRDESAPGPECYLAGHLGLPEVERRANWELNTTATLTDSSISDMLETMRSHWSRLIAHDDYFASSESEYSFTDDLEHRVEPVQPPIRPRLQRRTKHHAYSTAFERNAPPPRLFAAQSADVDSSSSTSSQNCQSTQFDAAPSPFVPKFHSSKQPINRSHPSSIFHSKHEAKQRFCMEPPRPLTIDPKHFISTKNRERTVTHVLSDCSESIAFISDPDVCQASVSSTAEHLDASDLCSSEPPIHDSAQLFSNDYTVSSVIQSDPFTDSDSTTQTPESPHHRSPQPSQWSNSESVFSAQSALLAMFDEFRDIDSTSTNTERSSTEPTPEPESSNRSVFLRSPFVQFPIKHHLTHSVPHSPPNDYDNIHVSPINHPPTSASSPFCSRTRHVSFVKTSPDSDSSGTSSADLDSVVSIRSQRHSKDILANSVSPLNQFVNGHIIRAPLPPGSTELERELNLLDATLLRLNTRNFVSPRAASFSVIGLQSGGPTTTATKPPIPRRSLAKISRVHTEPTIATPVSDIRRCRVAGPVHPGLSRVSSTAVDAAVVPTKHLRRTRFKTDTSTPLARSLSEPHLRDHSNLTGKA